MVLLQGFLCSIGIWDRRVPSAYVHAIRRWHTVQRFRSTFAFTMEVELAFGIGITVIDMGLLDVIDSSVLGSNVIGSGVVASSNGGSNVISSTVIDRGCWLHGGGSMSPSMWAVVLWQVVLLLAVVLWAVVLMAVMLLLVML